MSGHPGTVKRVDVGNKKGNPRYTKGKGIRYPREKGFVKRKSLFSAKTYSTRKATEAGASNKTPPPEVTPPKRKSQRGGPIQFGDKTDKKEKITASAHNGPYTSSQDRTKIKEELSPSKLHKGERPQLVHFRGLGWEGPSFSADATVCERESSRPQKKDGIGHGP